MGLIDRDYMRSDYEEKMCSKRKKEKIIEHLLYIGILFIFILFLYNNNLFLSDTQNIEKEVTGWWNENKPKAGFNPATYDIENMVFNKVNEERRKQGLRTLIWDSKLAEVARLHSLDMANKSYFSHDNPEGDDPTMRAIKNGYNVHKELGNGWYSDGIAENIGMTTSNNVADAMMKSWMNSPGHRANILDVNYDFIGVGVSYNGYGTYYLTQDFK